jgi:hypothetical protein
MMTHEQLPMFDPDEYGGHPIPWPGAPTPPPPAPKVGRDEKTRRVMDHLTASGIVPVKCAVCGAWGHGSAACPVRAAGETDAEHPPVATEARA